MLLLEFEDQVHAADVFVGHKAEATRLLRPLVLQDDAVFNLPEVQKVVLEGRLLEVVRQTTNENFPQLGVDLVTVCQGLLPNV